MLQVSSTTSMPFLRDDNLTFHRFTTDVSIDSSRRPSDDTMFSAPATTAVSDQHSPDTTQQYQNGGGGGGGDMLYNNNTKFTISQTNKEHYPLSSNNPLSSSSSVWTTNGGGGGHQTPTPSSTAATHYKHSYTTETNDFQYIPSNGSTTGKTVKSLQNGSTAKLMVQDDDQANKQVCSMYIVLIILFLL